MERFTCPSCGAEIRFQSSISVYAVCQYCASMVLRHDKDVEAIGKMAALPPDMSPLQIGTEGIYKGTRFGIIGRAKIGWADGNWNEWFLFVDDGRRGWLAEAQGFYAISFEIENLQDDVKMQQRIHALIQECREATVKRNASPIGTSIKLQSTILRVTDIKLAECVGSEGELPFTATKGRAATYIDMLGENGEFGSIEYSADLPPRVYLGEYVEFDMLRFTHLRELEGWRYVSPSF